MMATEERSAYICQCGCGEPIPPSWMHGVRYIPRFKKGHASRTPETKAKLREARQHRTERRTPNEAPLICQCGCGEEIPWKPTHRYRRTRYIQSHYLKISNNERMDALRAAKRKQRTQPPPDWQVPSGLCECGCGKPTKIAKTTRRDQDIYAGFPRRFVHGHHKRVAWSQPGPTHNSWKGGRYLKEGYIRIHQPNHPSSDSAGYIMEHRYVYEQSRGVTLPPNVLVHHINGIKTDNRPENLVAMTRMKHAETHRVASEIVGILFDDRLLAAVRAHVQAHGELPNLETLTQTLYHEEPPVF